MRKVPDDVREWLEFGMIRSDKIETKKISKLEGAEIITGIVGNSMTEDVRRFAEDHTNEDYLIVVTNQGRNEWGSMAVPFTKRRHAEKFEELVGEDGGGLRLTGGEYDGWFGFEAE